MQTIDARSVSAIYCDDIRQEVGGKITVVGMYPQGSPVQFPAQGAVMLHKFCVIGHIRTPLDRPLKSLVCELRLDDEVLHHVELPPDALNEREPTRPGRKGFAAQLVMEFGNMVISREGVLRFVAIVDGTEVYECPGLEFTKKPHTGNAN